MKQVIIGGDDNNMDDDDDYDDDNGGRLLNSVERKVDVTHEDGRGTSYRGQEVGEGDDGDAESCAGQSVTSWTFCSRISQGRLSLRTDLIRNMSSTPIPETQDESVRVRSTTGIRVSRKYHVNNEKISNILTSPKTITKHIW